MLLGRLDPDGNNFTWMRRFDKPGPANFHAKLWLHIDKVTDDIFVLFQDYTGLISSRDMYLSKFDTSGNLIWSNAYSNGTNMEYSGTNDEIQGTKPLVTSLDGSKLYLEWGNQNQRHLAAINTTTGAVLYAEDWDLAGQSISYDKYIAAVNISPYDESLVIGGTSFSSGTAGRSMYYRIQDTGSGFNIIDAALITGPYYNNIVKTEFMEDGTLLLSVPQNFDQAYGILRVAPDPTNPTIVWAMYYTSPGAGSFVGDGCNVIYDPGVNKIYNLSHNSRIGHPVDSDDGLNFNIIDPDNITEAFQSIDITTEATALSTYSYQLLELDSNDEPVLLYRHNNGATFPVTEPSDGVFTDVTSSWTISPLYPNPLGGTLSSLPDAQVWADAPSDIPPHAASPPSTLGFSIIKLGVSSIPCPDE